MTKRLTVGSAGLCTCFLMFFGALGSNAAAADGQKWTGTLIDATCKQAHETAKCDVTETTKSFGLMTMDGKFVKFDEAGNGKALAALQPHRDKLGEKKASITGALDGDTVKVEALQIH